MANFLRRKRVSTDKGVKPAPVPEGVESSNAGAPPPPPVMEQARQDIEAGLQDTDRHGMPGLEKPEKWRKK